MKTLAELRTEVELGIAVYPSNTGEYFITRVGDTSFPNVPTCRKGSFVAWYPLICAILGYSSFEELLYELPDAYKPIWTITKTPAHIQVEQKMEARGWEPMNPFE